MYLAQLRKITVFFCEGAERKMVELTVYGHGLQVSTVLPHVLLHILILVLEINPSVTGKENITFGFSSTKVFLGDFLYWFILTCTFLDL